MPTTRVAIDPLPLRADARGVVVEPVDPDRLPAQRNVHLVLTPPGKVRGNHYHVRGTEMVMVLGPALVRLREDGQVRDVPVPDGAAWRFTLPPGVSHAFQGTGEAMMILVGFNTEAHDRGAPDVVPDELIPM